MDNIVTLFSDFLSQYNAEEKDLLWKNQSAIFRAFWNDKILSNDKTEINDFETDRVIQILDRNGKGNTKDSEAVAKAMIAQGAWRRMFNDIKQHPELSKVLTDIFNTEDPEVRSGLIDQLYVINEQRKNNLTGKSGNAVNAMLAAWDPTKNLSVISLRDRQKLLQYFKDSELVNFETDSIGKKIVQSQLAIMNKFHELGINGSARTISVFLYYEPSKQLWRTEEDNEYVPWGGVKHPVVQSDDIQSDPSLFYMESQLEDFLIENWDKSELGNKYTLIEEQGELVSQQYPTPIGRIDILCQDKNTNQYVVIELKRDQTSDDTVGQLARYMGWIKENKSNGKQVKGIIITGRYDERLYYALKMFPEAEIYLYRVDFHLAEFKR